MPYKSFRVLAFDLEKKDLGKKKFKKCRKMSDGASPSSVLE